MQQHVGVQSAAVVTPDMHTAVSVHVGVLVVVDFGWEYTTASGACVVAMHCWHIWTCNFKWLSSGCAVQQSLDQCRGNAGEHEC